MAWNRPSEEKKVEVEKRGGQRNVRLKGLVAGVIVVVGATVATWWLWPDAKHQLSTSTSTSSSLIKEVKPAVVTTTVKPPEEKVEYLVNKRGERFPKPNQPVYQDQNGVWRYVKGNARVPVQHDEKYKISVQTPAPNHPVFNHDCENEIAALLVTRPGDALIGDFTYDKAYRDDFVQSLLEPIEILDTDSAEDKAIKREVQEIKHDLAKRIKDGEDLGAILQEARDESRRMATYKAELVDLFDESVANGETETMEDAETYMEAVNKMLESRGIEGFKMTTLMRKRIEYQLKTMREAKK